MISFSIWRTWFLIDCLINNIPINSNTVCRVTHMDSPSTTLVGIFFSYAVQRLEWHYINLVCGVCLGHHCVWTNVSCPQLFVWRCQTTIAFYRFSICNHLRIQMQERADTNVWIRPNCAISQSPTNTTILLLLNGKYLLDANQNSLFLWLDGTTSKEQINLSSCLQNLSEGEQHLSWLPNCEQSSRLWNKV